jgi:hypothetical protein
MSEKEILEELKKIRKANEETAKAAKKTNRRNHPFRKAGRKGWKKAWDNI